MLYVAVYSAFTFEVAFAHTNCRVPCYVCASGGDLAVTLLFRSFWWRKCSDIFAHTICVCTSFVGLTVFVL